MNITPEIQRELLIGSILSAQLKPLKSLEEVAQEMGVSRMTVSLIERRALCKMARAVFALLGLDEEEFIRSSAEQVTRGNLKTQTKSVLMHQ